MLCEGPGPNCGCFWLTGTRVWNLCGFCGFFCGLGWVYFPIGSGCHIPCGKRSKLGKAEKEKFGDREKTIWDSPCPLSSTGVSPREEQLLRGTLQRVAHPTRVMPASTPSAPESSVFTSLSKNISPGG